MKELRSQRQPMTVRQAELAELIAIAPGRHRELSRAS